MKFPRKHRLQETVELNITAFLNLMVILVPFLLITAVFSRITVLELNLPALDSQASAEEKLDLQLQLVIRQNYFDVQDATLGLIRRVDHGSDGPNWKLLSDVLLEVKRRFPEEQGITLLLEKAVNYKTMIDVMDRVGATDIVVAGTLETVELFPNISVGDAPEASANAAEAAVEDRSEAL